MKVLKAVWKFCSFLFVPQWGRHPKDDGTTEVRIKGTKDINSGQIIIKSYDDKRYRNTWTIWSV